MKEIKKGGCFSEDYMPLTNEKFNRIEKEFLRHLKKIHDDLNLSFTVIRNSQNGGTLVKSELCLAFVGVDTFSRIFRIFQGAIEGELDKNIEGRFKTWLSEFVLTNKNKVYKEHKEEIDCDVELAWQLRNSLIHFYGLPSPEILPYHLGFAGGNLERLRELKQKFQEIGKVNIRLIQPYYLIEAILYGLLVQLYAMKQMIKEKPKEYIDRILFAHKIIMLEGSVFVSDSQSSK